MARIHELLRQLRVTNVALADDIEREVDVLGARRAFGLNFERHTPEAVELPGRPVRTGDKVHILPSRGETPKAEHDKLWRVTSITRKGDDRVAELESYPRVELVESATVPTADLVVVAEFRDPIYPGLVSTGKVERGGDKPYHTVINGENYHALQTLLFTHRGKVDAIYIDPPYNTGSKDWKYNNDYVESDDLYRHSKWLAFMERRLLLARELLNSDDSVLIVTIDEKEVHRLGLLLQQIFPQSSPQLVTIVINPLGQERARQLSRVEEYAFFLFFGVAQPEPALDDLLNVPVAATDSHVPEQVRWERLIRGGGDATRRRSPDLFYPVWIDPDLRKIVDVGEPLPALSQRESVPSRTGLVPVWPLRENGSEGRWRCSPVYFRELLARGYARLGEYNKGRDQWTISYLGKAQIARVESNSIEIRGEGASGEVILGPAVPQAKRVSVKTVWARASHRAGEYGTTINGMLLGGRSFPYPKSLYSVEDALRVAVGGKPNATILDFFAGSGTTAHAVMRLNKQDDGRRYSISVTNNEVSASEQGDLRRNQLRPGDPEWEQWGICDYITKPRLAAAITGRNPAGEPVNAEYKFTDEFPMFDGFEENAEFLTLTYEAPLRLRANRDFERVAPLLWQRAGSRGRRVEEMPAGWDVAEAYGVLADLDKTEEFFQALTAMPSATVAFIVTDDNGIFGAIVAGLPDGVEPVRLYDAYFRNFEIDAMRGVR